MNSSNISYDQLLKLTTTILIQSLGYSPQEAAPTARVLVEADARGIPSHGVSRLAFYIKNIEHGHVHLGSEPEVVWQTPCSLVVDGHDGVGPYITDISVKKTRELAEKSGTAYCAVRNSNHYGIAGMWAEDLAQDNMIGMAFTISRQASIPTFGCRKMLGTNPIAVAIPLEPGRTFLLDMATTTVAHGKVELYDRRHKTMPLGWVVDDKGKGATDATSFEKLFLSSDLGGHLFVGGEGEETGGHKGFGLGLLVELLCSGLSLGLASIQSYGAERAGLCHFFGAFRLDLFGPASQIKSHLAEIVDSIRQSDKAEGQERIYIHGEKEAEARAKSLNQGIDMDQATKDFLLVQARNLSLTETDGLPQSWSL